jgi:hypothetical protein
VARESTVVHEGGIRLITGGSYNCRQTLLVSALEFENHTKEEHGKLWTFKEGQRQG